ncbi:uncharacterized protein LOC132851633 [Tachysurus vachellii]|uniref:uncharacterized protein LOC132851633 n=1 Tax=Tachysurus vachellii TaxID=175792 RepID=UPI00296AE06A|nr:uncharacterized protein LOC132851633 [Tachysurus vachellii]
MALYIQGVVPDNANQFSINFQTGQNKFDDIAFHFNPWIGQYVYLNSFQNGNWAVKDCVPDESFTKGAAFNMFIVIATDGYEVYVNDLKHYMFQHRIPLDKVTTLAIGGDVSIDFFGLCEVLPHVGKIRDRLKPEMAIFFQGALPAHTKEFEINFQTGQSDSDDIAFHFNPRIGQYVYLNSFRNGIWEKEERVSEELFTKGAAFYMFVVIGSEGYEVYVNGLQHCRFEHRIPLENVSTISIYGDVIIPIYGFIEAWEAQSRACYPSSQRFPIQSFFLFAINFQTGPSDSDSDIAFHFNARIGQYIYLNCFRNASWEQEETTPEKLLSKGAAFNMFIIISTEGYEALPYLGSIKEEIRPDMAVLFHGELSKHSKSFEINLLTGDSDYDDIAFHISPRTGRSVALNSFIDGSWETEEYASDNPFSNGAPFQMFFVIGSERYEVYVNNMKHCTFKHRIPLEKVSTLGIRGDVTINYFGIVKNWSASSMVRKINEIQEKLTISRMHISAEISHAVINPVLPYRGTIPEGLKTDIAVVFQGILPADAKEFAINFQTGESDGDDIAFHINPRIGDVVALNSFRNGSWETEEHASVTAFTKEEALNMSIAINSEGYEVYVNGLKHCTFNHRIPVENISTLGISGDVIIYYFGLVEKLNDSIVDVEMNKILDTSLTSGSLIDVPAEISHPVSNPKLNDSIVAVEMNKIQDTSLTSGSLIDVPAEISHPISNPELPYVDVIPGGLKTDMAVVFQGALPADSKQFAINFQTGKNDGDDIAFYINPRIGDVLALNSFRNGSWETEEHASVTAFTKEEDLNMSIAINSEGYEVHVNGLHQCSFNHRIPVENISTLGISGDVIIHYFGFVENWSDSSIFKKMNEIHAMSVTTGSLIDVCPEISPSISNPELPNVDVIPQGLKTDTDVMFQVTLPADANEYDFIILLPITQSHI